jgi:O-antigen/teichoic acid export membrane protein
MKHFFRSPYFKHAATLFSANSLSQAIALLVYPLLTRLYAPEDFGLFNLFFGIGGILAIIATANYHFAIVLPKDDRKADACLSLSLLFTLGVTCICVIALFFSASIASLFGTPSLADYLYLMPLFVLFTAGWNSFNYWFTRKQSYKPIAIYQITNSLGASVLKYIYGLLGYLAGGLLFGTIIAQLIAFGGSVQIAFKKGLKGVFSTPVAEIKQVANEYANFPRFSLPHSLVNTIGGSLPILLLTPFFSLSDIGFFGMAMVLAFRPINILSSSLHQVFYPISAQKVNDKQSIRPFLRKYISRSFWLTLPFFAMLYVILPWLTAWLLGNEWSVTGEYIRLMLPWLLVSAIVAPISYLADIFAQQKTALLLEISSILMRLGGLIIGILAENFYLAIALYCAASALIILVQLVWYWQLVSRYEKNLVNSL